MTCFRCLSSLVPLLLILVPVGAAQHYLTIPLYESGEHEVGKAFLEFSPFVPLPSFAVPAGTASYPQLAWPVGLPLGEGAFISNYVDDERASGTMIDYMGGRDHLYDNHRGTDIAIYNFRLMDKGVPIYAASAGTVTHTIYHFGDRNIAQPYPDGGNGLGIQHDDGTFSAYWHIRTNSVTVEPGERVEPGQLLAYIGSSGWTPVPHLHFEIAERRGFTEPYRDPWQGTHNTLPSLWEDQPPYVGDAPMWIMDIMVFPPSAVSGSFSNVNRSRLLEQIPSPAVFGSDESELCVVFELQANPGQAYRLDILQPDGTPFVRENATISSKIRYSWLGTCWNLQGEIPHGTWAVEILSGGEVIKRQPFVVGASTKYAPRFTPVAGQSIRLEDQRVAKQLRLSPLSEPATYHLVNAPSFAHLDGSTVIIDGNASDQAYRSSYFQAVATDGAGQTDTLWVHLVDPTKPFNPLSSQTATSVGHTPFEQPAQTLLLNAPFPNPADYRTTLRYTLAQPTFVHLEVFDLLGRRIETLVLEHQPAGAYHVQLKTSPLPSGMYTIRLATERTQEVQHLVVQH